MNYQINKTLERRQRITAVIERSLREAPIETAELLDSIANAYQSGKISEFWNFIAALGGADRGFGNDYFFTALEIQRQQKEAKNGTA